MNFRWKDITAIVFYTLLSLSIWVGDGLATLIDNRDGTVSDTETGLMWQQGESDSKYWTAIQASSYCNGLGLAGYSDWRLPTHEELSSLVDHNYSAPCININFFPQAFAGEYVTSTECPIIINQIFHVNFDNGAAYCGSMTFDFSQVRAVREVPVLDVISTWEIPANADSGVLGVHNAGTGTLNWIAEEASSWMNIFFGASGSISNLDGTIKVSFEHNTGAPRSAQITITAPGAINSPHTVTVIQAGDPLATDNDGEGYSENQGDCNDANSSIYPGAVEICGDGIDQDCNGSDLACPNNDSLSFVNNSGISGIHHPCYVFLSEAVYNSGDVSEIRLAAGKYCEDICFDRGSACVLSGGWAADFSAQNGGDSILDGSLTISAGSVVIDRLVIGKEDTNQCPVSIKGIVVDEPYPFCFFDIYLSNAERIVPGQDYVSIHEVFNNVEDVKLPIFSVDTLTGKITTMIPPLSAGYQPVTDLINIKIVYNDDKESSNSVELERIDSSRQPYASVEEVLNDTSAYFYDMADEIAAANGETSLTAEQQEALEKLSGLATDMTRVAEAFMTEILSEDEKNLLARYIVNTEMLENPVPNIIASETPQNSDQNFRQLRSSDPGMESINSRRKILKAYDHFDTCFNHRGIADFFAMISPFKLVWGSFKIIETIQRSQLFLPTLLTELKIEGLNDIYRGEQLELETIGTFAGVGNMAEVVSSTTLKLATSIYSMPQNLKNNITQIINLIGVSDLVERFIVDISSDVNPEEPTWNDCESCKDFYNYVSSALSQLGPIWTFECKFDWHSIYNSRDFILQPNPGSYPGVSDTSSFPTVEPVSPGREKLSILVYDMLKGDDINNCLVSCEAEFEILNHPPTMTNTSCSTDSEGKCQMNFTIEDEDDDIGDVQLTLLEGPKHGTYSGPPASGEYAFTDQLIPVADAKSATCPVGGQTTPIELTGSFPDYEDEKIVFELKDKWMTEQTGFYGLKTPVYGTVYEVPIDLTAVLDEAKKRLTFSITHDPQHGIAEIASKWARYTHDGGESTEDNFAYRVILDGTASPNAAPVDVQIGACLPPGVDVTYEGRYNNLDTGEEETTSVTVAIDLEGKTASITSEVWTGVVTGEVLIQNANRALFRVYTTDVLTEEEAGWPIEYTDDEWKTHVTRHRVTLEVMKDYVCSYAEVITRVVIEKFDELIYILNIDGSEYVQHIINHELVTVHDVSEMPGGG
ncbi:MAG: DUF1566 domain-containing protein [Deltaproteobacteria bacterium]|nr:DUF1566 domain-containing protein [Deltaproteobacteria bacterium]